MTKLAQIVLFCCLGHAGIADAAIFGSDDRVGFEDVGAYVRTQLFRATGVVECFDGHRSTAFLVDIDNYVETPPSFYVIATTASALYDTQSGVSRGRCAFQPANSPEIQVEIADHLSGGRQILGVRDDDWLFARIEGELGRVLPVPILFSDVYNFRAGTSREVWAVGFAEDMQSMALTQACTLEDKRNYEGLWKLSVELSKMIVHDCDFTGSAWGGPLALEFDGTFQVIGMHAGDGRVATDGPNLNGVPYDPKRNFHNYSRRFDLELEEKLIAFISRFTYVRNPSPSLTARSRLISSVQTHLNRLGYDSGQPDGLLGIKTIEAVRAFQSTLGITATGQISEELLLLLQSK